MNSVLIALRRPLDLVDKFLDGLTSYQLMLDFLYFVIGLGLVASLFHQVPYKWYAILASAGWLMFVCRATNWAMSRALNVPSNKNSDFITALILALILPPASNLHGFLILSVAAIFAMATKYLLTISRRHIFNPAAAGAFFTGAVLHQYASWWVGTKSLAPLVFLGGMLVLRKMKRFIMVTFFMITYLVILIITLPHTHLVHNVWTIFIASPLLFYAYVMLIEPLTTPSHMSAYIPYTVLVAILYGITRLRVSPENALLIGNFFAYLLEPSQRLQLSFVRKQEEASGIHSYLFNTRDKLKFKAGQYMEWTLPEAKSDSRGNRRYLTIASAPSEDNMMISVRLPASASSFKNRLEQLKPGDKMLASHLAGQFTLPKDTQQPLVFLAGGVGITPFRSMAKYLIDAQQKRPIVLFYSATSADEFAFTKLFKQAESAGLKTVYVISDSQKAPPGWRGHVGQIDEQAISAVVPGFKNQRFYVSGPYGFVHAMRTILLKLGVPMHQIVSDYFPGYG